MKVTVPKGKYVVAVSGGVDSVVLLDLLTSRESRVASQVASRNSKLETRNSFVVAHFDHGMRANSNEDERFVRESAESLGLSYASERAELGSDASEATAREARYEFLRRVKAKHRADKILTAHHEDDLLETMILNVLRGTGRKGLDPLLSSPDVLRPLLPYSKQEIIDYALSNGLEWRNDPSNMDEKYRRNAVRHTIMPKLFVKRQQLLAVNKDARLFNAEIETILSELTAYLLVEDALVRRRFVALPHKVAAEFMHWWLNKNDVKDVDAAVVTKATIAAKTLAPGKKINLGGGHWLLSGATSLQILQD